MVLLLFVVHFLLPSSGSAAECTDACQVPAANAKEPTITEEKAADGKTAVKAVFFIRGEPDLVCGILRDASRFPEFMPDTLEARIIESAADYHVADFTGSNGPIQSRFVMRRIFVDHERRISWTP